MAEVVSYHALLTPLPRKLHLTISRIGVSTAKTLRLARTSLEGLGVNLTRYDERDYGVTQSIGAAISSGRSHLAEAKEGRSSFLKKRSKKLLLLKLLGADRGANGPDMSEQIKVFWSFFSKKDCLPCLPFLPNAIALAISFLGLDGLMAPSARWPCDNLMIYQANHLMAERLEVIEEEEAAWQDWAQQNGFMPSDKQALE